MVTGFIGADSADTLSRIRREGTAIKQDVTIGVYCAGDTQANLCKRPPPTAVCVL